MNSECSDDDDSDEDAEDMVSSYDPNEQKRPKLPIYHPGFVLTERIASETLSVFLTFIDQAQKNGYTDSEVKHLWDEIVEKKKIPYQYEVKLAVAGETGAGKSALLNAILGVLNLTIEVCDQVYEVESTID